LAKSIPLQDLDKDNKAILYGGGAQTHPAMKTRNVLFLAFFSYKHLDDHVRIGFISHLTLDASSLLVFKTKIAHSFKPPY
jgi:hypothetical protein